MGRCVSCCLVFTLLVLFGATYSVEQSEQSEQTFDRALRTLDLFSTLKRAAEERGSVQKPEERKLKKFCKGEGSECKPPFKLCCGELECYWPDGWSLRKDGVCVMCLLENRTCQRDEQCCESMHCEKKASVNIDGTCMRPGPSGTGAPPGQERCAGMGQKCRRDSQCCQNQKHHLQCNKLRPVYIDGSCEKFRREGGCYRDGQCVNDCKKPWYKIYGECE